MSYELEALEALMTSAQRAREDDTLEITSSLQLPDDLFLSLLYGSVEAPLHLGQANDFSPSSLPLSVGEFEIRLGNRPLVTIDLGQAFLGDDEGYQLPREIEDPGEPKRWLLGNLEQARILLKINGGSLEPNEFARLLDEVGGCSYRDYQAGRSFVVPDPILHIAAAVEAPQLEQLDQSADRDAFNQILERHPGLSDLLDRS